MQTKIVVGSVVRWTSAAGELIGTIKRIDIDLNAAGDYVPWMLIEFLSESDEPMLPRTSTVYMNALPGHMKMMQMKVLRAASEVWEAI